MKTALCFCILVMTFYGCNSPSAEMEKQYADLQRSNGELAQELKARDEYVDQVTVSINNVYGNLKSVQGKENMILKEKSEMEAGKQYSHEQIRAMLMDKIGSINMEMTNNRKTLDDLQSKINKYRSQYDGIRKLVGNLKATIEEREHSIADLTQRIQGLENTVAEKTSLVNQRDLVIDQQTRTLDDQYKMITTVYYITGTRDELEKLGIIKKEGGFMWGLLGSTTTLASGFNDKYFKPINKTAQHSIQVEGKIDDIVPRRNEEFYNKAEMTGGEQSLLTIAEPDHFWQDKYLVIITDHPSNGVNN